MAATRYAVKYFQQIPGASPMQNYEMWHKNDADFKAGLTQIKAQKYKEAKAGWAPVPASGSSPTPTAQPQAPGSPQLSGQAGSAPVPQDSATIDQRSPAMQASGLQDMAAGYSPMSGAAIKQPTPMVSGPVGGGKTAALPVGTTQDINSHQMNIPGQPQPEAQPPGQMAGSAPAAPASEYERLKGMKDKFGDVKEYQTDISSARSDEIGKELPHILEAGNTTQEEVMRELGKKYGSDVLQDPGVQDYVKSLMSTKDVEANKLRGEMHKETLDAQRKIAALRKNNGRAPSGTERANILSKAAAYKFKMTEINTKVSKLEKDYSDAVKLGRPTGKSATGKLTYDTNDQSLAGEIKTQLESAHKDQKYIQQGLQTWEQLEKELNAGKITEYDQQGDNVQIGTDNTPIEW